MFNISPKPFSVVEQGILNSNNGIGRDQAITSEKNQSSQAIRDYVMDTIAKNTGEGQKIVNSVKLAVKTIQEDMNNGGTNAFANKDYYGHYDEATFNHLTHDPEAKANLEKICMHTSRPLGDTKVSLWETNYADSAEALRVWLGSDEVNRGIADAAANRTNLAGTSRPADLSNFNSAIYMPVPSRELFQIACNENNTRNGKGKDIIPIIANNEGDRAALEAFKNDFRNQVQSIANGGPVDPTICSNRQVAERMLATLDKTVIGTVDDLKKISPDGKLRILGHGQHNDDAVGDSFFDAARLGLGDDTREMRQRARTETAQQREEMIAAHEEDPERLAVEPGVFGFITAEGIATNLQGKLPDGFTKFETLSCHSAEARRPASFDRVDLDGATVTAGDGSNKQEAYAQTLVNALANKGFDNPQVKGYIGAVVANVDGNGRRTNVTITDVNDSKAASHGRDVKRTFRPNE